MPGVSAAGAVSNLPLNGGGTNTFRIEGEPEPDAPSRPEATMRAVAGDYFQAMGIPLLTGRLFTARDDSAAQGVLVISRSFARLFPGGNPVGRGLRFYAFPDTTWEIAGVVGDVRPGRIDGTAPPVIYYTHLQAAENRMTLAVRTSGAAGPILSAVRAELGTMGSDVALYAESTMEDVVGNSGAVVARRYPLRVIGAFAAVALLLAVAGIYGVMANGVTERRRELGIRSALGARAGQLVRLILRRGAVIIVLGVLSGSALALAFSRTMSALLYGVEPNDPATLLTVILVLAGTALLACWWPARRAGQVNPVEVLNQDG
jgi:putative ABC transport system permease protein